MSLNLKSFGSDFDVGELVSVSFRDGSGTMVTKTGVVMDYYRSNVYEPSSYQILVEGETRYVQFNRVRTWKTS